MWIILHEIKYDIQNSIVWFDNTLIELVKWNLK